jgi:primase-polymerase (primpol)-like protein
MNIEQLRTALAGPLAPLAQYRQFVLWRLETGDDGKPTKVPYSTVGGYASSTNPMTWTDANTALQYAHSSPGFGVGFVLTDSDPFRVVDIDHCLQGGKWSDFALGVLAQFPGAAVEVSQSGEGLHIWMQGPLPEKFGKKTQGLEFYASERFIALTGDRIPAGTTAATVIPHLAQFVALNFPPKQQISGDLEWRVGAVEEAGNVPTDDEELLRMFLTAPPAKPFVDAANAFGHLVPGGVAKVERVPVSNADLFNANVAVLSQAWPSDKGEGFDKSDAAFALACRLAMWTGKDCPRMERLMYRAAFQRTKAEQFHHADVTYMRWDVMRACVTMERVRQWSTAEQKSEAIREQGVNSYDLYHSRIAAASGQVHVMRAIAAEIALDLSIDKAYRKMLAGDIFDYMKAGGQAGLSLKDCQALVQVQSSRTATDLKEAQRRINEALSLPANTVMFAPNMSLAEMLEEFVFISEGSLVGSLSNPHMAFTQTDFRNTFAPSHSITPDGKKLYHADQWVEYPNGRKRAFTRTFRAGAPVITVNPDGLESLNIWRPIVRGPQTVDVSPFLEHVHFLFGSDSDKFLDWLAHIEQKPGELPHYGWLHIADEFGMGRGWLATMITCLWKSYAAPSVDMGALISGSFNGAIAGKLIAVVDEIRAGARDDAYAAESFIRGMINEPVRNVNPKYGRQYREYNACRWLICSNHKNALPMAKGDRRLWVVHKTGLPRSPATYEYLYALQDNQQFIDSLGAWLAARDISNFKPGERPPLNEAKRSAISASQTDFQRVAYQIADKWPSDFISTSDLVNCMYEGDMQSAGKRLTAAMRHALDDAGLTLLEQQLRFRNDAVRFRGWIVRNEAHWLANLSGTAAELEIMKTTLTPTISAYSKLLDVL